MDAQQAGMQHPGGVTQTPLTQKKTASQAQAEALRTRKILVTPPDHVGSQVLVYNIRPAPRVPHYMNLHGGLLTAEQWADEGLWVMVESSNVSSIFYAKDSHHLFVGFRDGSIYKYDAVPLNVALDMFNASSMGKFIWQRLRDKFNATKIKEGNKATTGKAKRAVKQVRPRRRGRSRS